MQTKVSSFLVYPSFYGQSLQIQNFVALWPLDCTLKTDKHLSVSESTSDGDQRDVFERRLVVESPKLVDVVVELVQVVVGHDDGPMRRRERDDRVHPDGVKVLMEVERPENNFTNKRL